MEDDEFHLDIESWVERQDQLAELQDDDEVEDEW